MSPRPATPQCEDTSLLLTAMLEELGVDVYCVFGVVYRDGRYLGGHGFVIAELEGDWRLIETTLDVPMPYPSGWALIDPNENDWRWGRLTYHGWLRFNSKSYEVWVEDTGASVADDMNFFLQEIVYGKHSYRKYKAIAEEWGVPTKPLKRLSWYKRVLWRLASRWKYGG